jgi:hypothetical protein
MPRLKAILLSLATLSATAFAANANLARPGTINYVEGQATLAGHSIDARSVGSSELQVGQSLETTSGRAEVLLTPGVFLRIDNNSSVRMVSPGLTHTEIALDRGHAEVEADQLYKENDLIIDQDQAHVKLLKPGLYDFDASGRDVRVFDGKARVSGAFAVKSLTLKGGHELAFNGDAVKPAKFDRKSAHNDFYNWNSLRSQYLGEANVQLASQYAGYDSFAPGWFWDPYLAGYTWLPGDGFFWNPFGYGFYSPYYLYRGGYVYGGRGGRFGYGRDLGRSPGGRPVGGPAHPVGGFHSRGTGSGFHGGGMGGGFHGGGMGAGGFHGGAGGHR